MFYTRSLLNLQSPVVQTSWLVPLTWAAVTVCSTTALQQQATTDCAVDVFAESFFVVREQWKRVLWAHFVHIMSDEESVRHLWLSHSHY